MRVLQAGQKGLPQPDLNPAQFSILPMYTLRLKPGIPSASISTAWCSFLNQVGKSRPAGTIKLQRTQALPDDDLPDFDATPGILHE